MPPPQRAEGDKDFAAPQYGMSKWWILRWIQSVWDDDMSTTAKRVRGVTLVSLVLALGFGAGVLFDGVKFPPA